MTPLERPKLYETARPNVFSAPSSNGIVYVGAIVMFRLKTMPAARRAWNQLSEAVAETPASVAVARA
jgi:hypothetical protein